MGKPFDEAWDDGRADREEILERLKYEAELVQWWPSGVARPSEGHWGRLEAMFDRAWSIDSEQIKYDARFNEIAERLKDEGT